MIHSFDVRRELDIVLLMVQPSPEGMRFCWYLTVREATELAEALECGDVCGDAGDYAYQVTPAKGSEKPTLTLGLGRNTAEVSWDTSPDVIKGMAAAIRKAIKS